MFGRGLGHFKSGVNNRERCTVQDNDTVSPVQTPEHDELMPKNPYTVLGLAASSYAAYESSPSELCPTNVERAQAATGLYDLVDTLLTRYAPDSDCIHDDDQSVQIQQVLLEIPTQDGTPVWATARKEIDTDNGENSTAMIALCDDTGKYGCAFSTEIDSLNRLHVRKEIAGASSRNTNNVGPQVIKVLAGVMSTQAQPIK